MSRLSSQVTVRDVRGRYGLSLVYIAARLVIVSMQYATLDSAQYNVPFTQLKLRGYQNMLHVIIFKPRFSYICTLAPGMVIWM